MWTPLKTTGELLRAREERRDQYGWKVDFDDFKMPFLANVDEKLDEVAEREAFANYIKMKKWKKPKAKKEKKKK